MRKEKDLSVLLPWDEIYTAGGEARRKWWETDRHEAIISRINQFYWLITSNQLLQPKKAVWICLCWWHTAVKVIFL